MHLLDGGEPRRWSRRYRAEPGDTASHVRWMWGFDRESTPPAAVRVAIDRVALESPEFGGKTGIASGLKMELELPVVVRVAEAPNTMAVAGAESDDAEESDGA